MRKRKKKTEANLRELLQTDEEFKKIWKRISAEKQEEMLAVSDGKMMPNLLSDAMFKGLFDPDTHGDRLSRFISSVLGKKVKVLHSLKNEGNRHSIHSKGIVMDMVAQFEDEAICNVEIQRVGVALPTKRSACYSADLVTRQYAAKRGRKKGEFDYDSIQPVYTIVIFEKSPEEFRISGRYVHHFCQKSDTGVEVELLQYYTYICLDVFQEKSSQKESGAKDKGAPDAPVAAPPVEKSIAEKWLKFFTIRDMDEMVRFLAKEKSFQDVFSHAIIMTKDREELLRMITDIFMDEDIAGSINLTNESTIRRLKGELRESRAELRKNRKALQEKDACIQEKDARIQEKDTCIQEKDACIQEKDARIRELEKQLAEKDNLG